MPSIFNTTRNTTSQGDMASSEYAAITVGSQLSLGQNVHGTYTRQIQTIYELGRPEIYWIAGHEQGNLSVSRLVGKNGFFEAIGSEQCGAISNLKIDLTSGTCSKAKGGLSFDGAMLEGITFSMQAGTLEITEGVTIRFQTLNRTK